MTDRVRVDEDEDVIPTDFSLPAEAAEADAIEQSRVEPIDDDDWR